MEPPGHRTNAVHYVGFPTTASTPAQAAADVSAAFAAVAPVYGEQGVVLAADLPQDILELLRAEVGPGVQEQGEMLWVVGTTRSEPLVRAFSAFWEWCLNGPVVWLTRTDPWDPGSVSSVVEVVRRRLPLFRRPLFLGGPWGLAAEKVRGLLAHAEAMAVRGHDGDVVDFLVSPPTMDRALPLARTLAKTLPGAFWRSYGA